eukprot:5831732-Pyramimonas_sp.AAC.1
MQVIAEAISPPPPYVKANPFTEDSIHKGDLSLTIEKGITWSMPPAPPQAEVLAPGDGVLWPGDKSAAAAATAAHNRWMESMNARKRVYEDLLEEVGGPLVVHPPPSEGPLIVNPPPSKGPWIGLRNQYVVLHTELAPENPGCSQRW